MSESDVPSPRRTPVRTLAGGGHVVIGAVLVAAGLIFRDRSDGGQGEVFGWFLLVPGAALVFVGLVAIGAGLALEAHERDRTTSADG